MRYFKIFNMLLDCVMAHMLQAYKKKNEKSAYCQMLEYKMNILEWGKDQR